MKMLATCFLFAVFIQLSACGYVDVDSVNIDSPSDIIGGENTTIQFDITFTPVDGAAAAIEASHGSTRFLLGAALSSLDDFSSLVGLSSVSLSSAQQTTNLTDDSSVTWSDLTIELDLTSVDCGNGTLYTYFCLGLMEYSGVTWSGVDTDNATVCASFRCKATADVGIDSLTVTNPDDEIVNIGGGQLVEFDLGISSAADSDDIIGQTNWKVTTFLSDSEDGSSPVATVSSASLDSSELTKDLAASGSATLSSVAATFDLTDVECDEISYICATIAPHGNAYWKFDAGAALDTTVCSAITCGAGITQISFIMMLVCVAVSRLFNYS